MKGGAEWSGIFRALLTNTFFMEEMTNELSYFTYWGCNRSVVNALIFLPQIWMRLFYYRVL